MSPSAGPPPVQNRALTTTTAKLDDVVKSLEKRNDQFLDLLGKDNVARWKAVALHALAQNKNVLRDCTALSIVEAIRESAALGLSPTGLLGEGWILPYKDQARFMPGYRGYLKLLRNSGQIRIADAQIVYMEDDFAVQLGTDPKIHHVPILYGEKNEAGDYLADRGDFRGAYAWVRLTSGETMIEWMTFDDLMKVRAHSPSANRGEGPWITDPGEMMRKTPIRRIVKRLPLESMPLVARAATLDEEGDIIEGEATEVPVSAARATAAAYALGRGANGDDSEPQGQPESATDQAVGCGVLTPSDYAAGACVLPLEHDGNHKDAAGQTWS
jgi:phage RecT family recombinase